MSDIKKTKQQFLDEIKKTRKKVKTKNSTSKLTQKQIAEKDKFYSDLVEMTSDWIWSVGKNGKFIYSNSKVKDILGFSPKEVLGKTPVDLMTKNEAKQYKYTFKELFNFHQSFRMIDNEYLHKNGKTKILETSGEPIFDNKGNFNGFRGISRDITELKRTINKLKDEENKFKGLVHKSLVGVYIIQDGKFPYVNPKLAEIFGYKQNEIINKITVSQLVAPLDRKTVTDNIKKRLKDKAKAINYSFKGLKKDKTIFDVEVYGTGTIYNNKPAVIGTLIDITERKKAEEELKESEKRFQDLYEHAPTMYLSVDAKTSNIINCNQTTADVLGYSKEEITGKSVFDFYTPASSEYAKEKIFPKFVKTGIVKGEKLQVVKKDKSILTVILDATSVHDTNGKIIYSRSIWKDITDWKKTKEELKVSKEKYLTLFENSNDGIFLHDLKGKIIDVNKKVLKQFGYTKSEMLLMNIRNLHYPEEFNKSKKAFSTIIRQGYVSFEINFKKKNGQIFPAEVSSNIIIINNQKLVQGLVRDITERKKYLQELRFQEQQLRLIYDSVGDIIYYLKVEPGSQYRFISVNKSFLTATGLTEEQVIGKIINQVIPKTSLQLVRSNYSKAIREKSIVYWEETSQYPTGMKTGIVSIAPIFDNYGKCTHLIGSVHDITDRKKVEDKLKESEQWNKEIFEGSRDAIFIVDENADIVDVNQAAEFLTGYSKSQLLKMSIPDLHKEEDLVAFNKFFKKIIGGKSVTSEAKLLRKDGTIIETEFSNKQVIINGVAYMHSVARDITERKKIVEELKESEEKYQALIDDVLDKSAVGIFILDSKFKIVWINNSIEKYFGLKRTNVIGKDKRKLLREKIKNIFEEPEYFAEKILTAYDNKTYIEKFECHILKGRNRKERWLEHWSQPIKSGLYEGGRIEQYTDITYRKNTEDELKISEARYRGVVENARDSISITNEEGKLIEWNNALEELTGIPSEKVLGKYIWDVLYKLNVPELQANYNYKQLKEDLIRLLKTGKAPYLDKTIEMPLIKTDGTKIFIEQKISRVKTDKGFLLVSRANDITERKIAQEELMLSEKRYRALFEKNLAGVYLSTVEGKILDCNNAVVKMFGFKSKNELLKNNTNDLYQFKIERKIFVEKLKKYGSLENYEAVGKKKDGTLINTLMNVSLLSDNIMQGTIIDITELKVAEEKNSKLASIVEYSNDAIISKNLDGIITSWNKGAEKIYGYSSKEVVGKSISIILPREIENEYKSILKKIKNNRLIYNLISKRLTKDGRIIDVALTVSPIKDNKGEVISASTIERDITEIIKTENELKESEQRYKVLFEENLAGVYRSNLEGEILDCNDAFVKMYGYSSKEEILKISAKKLHINEKERKYFIERLKEKGSLLNYESTGKKKDGSLLWITENVHLIDGSILHGTIIDITERKEADKKILQLSRGVEQSPEMVIITDVEGNIEYVNPKVTEITGYTKEELIGKNPRIFRSDETPKETYKELWDTILQGKIWKGELLNKRKRGGLFWENVIIAPIIDNEGNIINFIGIKEDITDKKRMREELIRAKEKAEEISELKSNFLANMSHELRTPMVGILGFTEILQENIEDEEMRGYAKLLHDSGSRLMDTLNLILNLTKIEANKLVIEKTSVDVISVIKRVINLFKTAADKKNLYLNFENENDKLFTETDEKMFEEILNNLISNAIKFTTEGGITVSANRVKNNHHLEIIVKDTGIGIHKDKQGLIWEEFRQASEGAARLFEGTGLGLTITNNFVKKLGGEILLESDIGKGSTFIVRIPIQGKTEYTETTESLKSNIENKSVKIEEGKNLPTILLVDDDKVTRDVTERFLRGLYNLDFAVDGTEGIEKASNKNYDIILMDINLKSKPGGVEVTKRIRELEEHNNTPIIAVTAYAMVGDREKYLESGFTDYISKPFTKNDLIDLLQIYNPKK